MDADRLLKPDYINNIVTMFIHIYHLRNLTSRVLSLVAKTNVRISTMPLPSDNKHGLGW